MSIRYIPKMMKGWSGEGLGTALAPSWTRWAPPPETGATDKDYKPIARLPFGGCEGQRMAAGHRGHRKGSRGPGGDGVLICVEGMA